ncbi:hypothetical protein [Nocardia sp. NPDC049707]|uniref:hypothetical protein n=1 Tax=Nocardia sp. NPDC049707 TaxID=3154735 RepID=UPI00342724D5
MGRGLDGLMLKAWRAEDYRLTVTSTEFSDTCMRLGFDAGGLLADHPGTVGSRRRADGRPDEWCWTNAPPSRNRP